MSKPFVERVVSVTQGISKQAPSIRFPGQVEDATNVSFNVVDGARKRKGSAFLGFIGGASGTASYRMHKIDRDDREEYVIVYGRGMFEVYDLRRLERSPVTMTTRAERYIYENSPSADDYRFSTIADTTFVVNRLVQPKTDAIGRELRADTMPMILQRTSYSEDSGATFELKEAPWAKRSYNYQLLTMSTEATSGGFRLRYAGATSVELPFDATAEQVQKAIEGNGFDANDFIVDEQVTTTQTSGDTETTTTTYTGNQIDTDLPPRAGTIEGKAIEGLPTFTYGKVIVTGGPINRQRMQIRISPDIEINDQIEVVSNTTGSNVSISIGDPDDDPPPAFAQQPGANGQAGGRIADISFVRNRLAIASDEVISFSRTDNVYAFYREEPPTLIASDAFDVALAADDVCMIERMTTFRGAMILLTASGQQFEVSGLERLSATNVAVTATTRYNTQDVAPAKIGERLYIAADGGNCSRVLEYFFNNDAVSNTAIDVTRHVDDLVPETTMTLTSNPNRETVYVLTELKNDLTGEEYVTRCDDATEMDWDLCATWGNEGIPQPFDTAIVTDGCVVYRSDDDYETTDCVGGLAAHPTFQTAPSKRGPCCHNVAAPIPCSCTGASASNCNCMPSTCPECQCSNKGARIFGCRPVLTFIRRLGNFFRDRGPDIDCTYGSCCIGNECSYVCQERCAGTFTAGQACAPSTCVDPPTATCGCCCFATGQNQTGLEYTECIELGGQCRADCESCSDRGGGGGGEENPGGEGEEGGEPGDGYGDPTNTGIEGQIYVYQTYVEGQERKQSAWSRWLLGKDRLMDVVCFDDELIILRKQTLSVGANILCIESIDLSEDKTPPSVIVGNTTSEFPMTVHLDHMAAIKGGVYTSDDGYTKWSLSESAAFPTGYTDYEIDTAVDVSGNSYALVATDDGQGIRTSSDVDLTDTLLLIGRKVKSTVELSETFARDNEKKAILDGRTTLKKVVVTTSDTYAYDIVVTSDEPNAVARTHSVVNSTAVAVDGEESLYTQGNTEKTQITFQSDNAFPACFTSYEIHGLVTVQIADGGS